MPLNIKHKKIITNAIKRSNPRTVILQLINKALKYNRKTYKTEEILKFISHKYYNKNHFGSFARRDDILPNWPPWARNLVCWFIPEPDLEKGEAIDTIKPLASINTGSIHANDLRRDRLIEQQLDQKLIDKLAQFILIMKDRLEEKKLENIYSVGFDLDEVDDERSSTLDAYS
tara:strand:- start:3251 stop:3769 length:519 start_codon:yes stop_codon:yes gene_type:complete